MRKALPSPSCKREQRGITQVDESHTSHQAEGFRGVTRERSPGASGRASFQEKPSPSSNGTAGMLFNLQFSCATLANQSLESACCASGAIALETTSTSDASTRRWFQEAPYRNAQGSGRSEEVEEIKNDLKQLLRGQETPPGPRVEVAHGIEEHDRGRVVHHTLPEHQAVQQRLLVLVQYLSTVKHCAPVQWSVRGGSLDKP